MEVIEIRNPKALMLPEVQDLLRRAVDSGVLMTKVPFDTLAKDFFDLVTDDNQFMLLGAEKGAFKSVALCYLPTGNLFPFPTIPLIYNEGSKALLEATKTKLIDMIVAQGYTRTLAVNSSGHTDKAWLKVITPKRATSKIVGSLAIFEVE